MHQLTTRKNNQKVFLSTAKHALFKVAKYNSLEFDKNKNPTLTSTYHHWHEWQNTVLQANLKYNEPQIVSYILTVDDKYTNHPLKRR